MSEAPVNFVATVHARYQAAFEEALREIARMARRLGLLDAEGVAAYRTRVRRAGQARARSQRNTPRRRKHGRPRGLKRGKRRG